jgi:hypothetical protein
MTVQQIQAIQAAQMAGGRPANARKLPEFSVGQRIIRTAFAAVLVAGAAAGARFGWSEYQERQTADEVVAEAGGFYGPIGSGLPTVEAEPLDGRFVDVTIKVSDETAGTGGTFRIRSSLTSRNLTLEADNMTVEGPEVYGLDVRGEQVSIRPSGQSSWIDLPGSEALAEVQAFEDVARLVPMFHDLVPVDALPFVELISETDEQLPVVPLDVDVDLGVVSDDGITTSGNVDPLLVDTLEEVVADPNLPIGADGRRVVRPAGPVDVRHYRLSMDGEAFAAADPVGYAQWYDRSDDGGDLIDLWVDQNGVVRKFLNVEDQTTTSFLLNDVAYELPDFQTTAIIRMAVPAEGE